MSERACDHCKRPFIPMDDAFHLCPRCIGEGVAWERPLLTDEQRERLRDMHERGDG